MIPVFTLKLVTSCNAALNVFREDRQYTYNVTLRSVRVATVAMKKQ